MSTASRGVVPGSPASLTPLLAGFGQVSTATLASQLRKRGLNGLTMDGLRTTKPGQRMAGFARTLRYLPLREDLFARYGGGMNAQKQAIEQIRPGEVLVIDARQEPSAGTIGDILALRAQARGAAGIVTDGAIRDAARLAELDIPAYHAAVHPAVLGRRHVPWEWGVTVACAGVTVQQGDLVVGDDDGVVVLPPGLAPEILADALEQERQEEFVATQVASGAELTGCTARRTLAGSLAGLGQRTRAGRTEAGTGAGRADAMRFRTNPSTLRGSIAPVVTPFTEDGQLDTEGLAPDQLELDSGSQGISLGGSTGEPSAQTTQERIAAMTEAARVIADRVPFLPGTGSARLDETLELTAAAAELGADAALVITPYYARPTQEGLFQWYATVAGQNQDLPIVVYNVPSRTAVDIAPETIARLRRRYDNIVGVKETTRDFEHFSRVLHQCGRDILVWSGIELLCLPLLALGGVGFVSAVANLAPAAVAQMFDLWTAGEHEKARELHFALHPLVDVIFAETNPAPAKWVLRQAGLLGSAHVRPPLAAVSEPGSAGSPACCAPGPGADPAAHRPGGTAVHSGLPGRLDHFIAGAWSPSKGGATSPSPTP